MCLYSVDKRIALPKEWKKKEFIRVWREVRERRNSRHPLHQKTDTRFRAGINVATKEFVCGNFYMSGFHSYFNRKDARSPWLSRKRIAAFIHRDWIICTGEQKDKKVVVSSHIIMPPYPETRLTLTKAKSYYRAKKRSK